MTKTQALGWANRQRKLYRAGELARDRVRRLRDYGVALDGSVKQKQDKLIEMARNGEPRPTFRTELGQALANYTHSNRPRDLEFTSTIRELRSDWCMSLTDMANQKKERLLEMARRGDPRPTRREELGSAFSSYTTPRSKTYDEMFTGKIRMIRPDWLLSRIEIVFQRKEKLLEMARRGERPDRHTPLGVLFYSYLSRSQGGYDEVFARKIWELLPDLKPVEMARVVG